MFTGLLQKRKLCERLVTLVAVLGHIGITLVQLLLWPSVAAAALKNRTLRPEPLSKPSIQTQCYIE